MKRLALVLAVLALAGCVSVQEQGAAPATPPAAASGASCADAELEFSRASYDLAQQAEAGAVSDAAYARYQAALPARVSCGGAAPYASYSKPQYGTGAFNDYSYARGYLLALAYNGDYNTPEFAQAHADYVKLKKYYEETR